MGNLFKRYIHLILGLLFLTAAALPGMTEGAKKVLVLNSYHNGYFWSDRMMNGVNSVITAESGIDLHINYMDTKRISDPDYLLLRDLYLRKYAGAAFDAVLATDDHALNFLLAHRDRLFPGVPVVFAGINDYEPSRTAGHSGYTGLSEDYDMKANLELVLSLYPDIERIAVVVDTTLTGRAMESRLRKTEALLSTDIAVEYWNCMEPEEISARLRALGGSTAVLWAIYLRTPSGRYISTRDSLKMVTGAAALPVFCLWDVVGLGVLGGRVADPEYLGRQAAAMLLEVLDGADPDSMPVEESCMTYVFDYRVMKAAGVKPSGLPLPRTVRYRPFSFIREYPLIMGLTAAVFLLLLLIIAVLLVTHRMNVKRRILVERTLEQRTVLLKELHHRTKNNMQMLASMISLSAAEAGGKNMTTVLNELENRIHTISLVHSILYESDDLSRINLREYAETLLPMIKSGYNYTGKPFGLEIEAPDCSVNIDIAVALGSVLNELFSNSCKYAFPDGGGLVRLEISRIDQHLRIMYTDNGVGVEDADAIFDTDSLGLLTVREIVLNQLGGRLDVRAGSGLTYYIEIDESAYRSRL